MSKTAVVSGMASKGDKRKVSASSEKLATKKVPVASMSENFEDLVHQEKISYTDVNAFAGTDIDIVASRIAVEVTFALSEEISELNVYSSSFRMGLHRLARWILVSLFESTERCVVVPDAIPGYTAMGFKRDGFELKGVKGEQYVPGLGNETVERQAATMIMERFLGSTKTQVVVVECRDLLLILFPVSDMRSNMKKLGYIFGD